MPRILVADDEEPVVRQIALALTPLGYRVEAAGDGREALRRLRIESFDLLILDVMMPWMDGIEVLQALQKRPPAGPLPIIMLTARSARVEDWEERAAWLRGIGAADVLPNGPVNNADLIQAVQRLLGPEGLLPGARSAGG